MYFIDDVSRLFSCNDHCTACITLRKTLKYGKSGYRKVVKKGRKKEGRTEQGKGKGEKEKKTSCTTKSSFICTVSDNYEINAYIRGGWTAPCKELWVEHHFGFI